MAKPLMSASVAAPGFYGLNSQESSVTLAAGFALEATNCVIDKFGRLGARKGREIQTDVAYVGVDLQGAHEFIDIDGTVTNIVWNDTTFYDAGASFNILTGITDNSTAFTSANFDSSTLNDKAFFVQRGDEPRYYDPVSNTIEDVSNITRNATVTITSAATTATVTHTSHGFADGRSVTISGATETEYNGTYTITVVDANTYTYTFAGSGTSPATGTITATWNILAPPSANVSLSAYGRLWIADTDTNKTTVYWSNLLDGTDFYTGTAGSIDLSSILVRGNDEIVALGAHVGRLIVFCKRNIIIFQDTDADQVLDPVNMRLTEVIRGTGCVARDSVQNTGSDIIFLSDTGVQSLGRLIQEKSQPMRDLSRNVRDEVINISNLSDKTLIRSVYVPREAFYLLLFPEYNQVYCFDTRAPLQDGSARVTQWDRQSQNNMFKADEQLFFCGQDGVYKYSSYLDDGTAYILKYYTNYFDFGDSTNTKILKRIGSTVIGGNGQTFVLKAGFDYEDSYVSYPVKLDNLPNSEWGVGEYGIAQYSIGTPVDQVRAPLGGDGNVIQVGLEASIQGSALSIQRIDIYVKQGRIR